MKIIMFSCSEVSVLDGRTNALSLINILEDINVLAFPAVIPRLTICFIVRRNESETEDAPAAVKIKLSEVTLFEQAVNVAFFNRNQARGILELQGLIVPSPGILTFSLEIANSVSAEWTVQVNNLGNVQASVIS
jgi:hypothetical protein